MKRKHVLAAGLVVLASMLPARPAAAAAWSTWESLDHKIPDGIGIAATSWGRNRIDLFTAGRDTAIWHRWWDGRSWNSWESLGGCTNATPTAVSTDPGSVDVFVVGCGSATSPLWHKSFRSGRWSDWISEGGAYVVGLAATTWGHGRWDVFTVSANARLNHVWFDGTVRSEELYLNGDSISAVAAVAWAPGRIDVFTINNALLKQRTYDNGWGASWQVRSDQANRGIGVSSWAPGRLDLFSRGNNTDATNGTIYHQWHSRGTWEPGDGTRESLGGVALGAPIGAVSWGSGRIDVFVHGTDHAVWHKWYG